MLVACAASHEAPDERSEPDDASDLPSAEPSPLEGVAATVVADPLCDSDTQTTEIALSDSTELGFSAEDVLAFAAGMGTATLHWADREGLELSPETGLHELYFEVQPRGARARLVDPTTSIVGHGLICQTWMEIDVTIALRSDGGALNERIEATLFAQSPYVAFTEATALGAALAGALVARNTANDTEPTSLSLALSFAASGVSGQLTASWPAPLDASNGAATLGSELAYFGPVRCERGYAIDLNAGVDTVTPQALLDRIAALDPVLIVWSDGNTTGASMSFSPEPGACVSDYRNLSEPERGLSMEGRLALHSGDGRLVGSYAATFGVDLDSTADVPPLYANVGFIPDPPADIITPAQLGFPMESRDGFDQLELRLSISLDENDRMSGEVELIGRKDEPCNEPDQGLVCGSTPTTLELGTLL